MPRFQFSLRTLLILMAVVAVGLGIWATFLRKIVTIRSVTADDLVHKRYFGIDDDVNRIRNIVVVEGVFSRSTWLSSELYLVEAGKVQQVNGFNVGRSSNRIGEMPWVTMAITLALGDKDSPGGQMTQLGSAGHHRGSGGGGKVTHKFETPFSKTLANSIVPGRTHIIYVEGDRQAVVSGDMTMQEFVQRNAGKYLVVTAELH